MALQLVVEIDSVTNDGDTRTLNIVDSTGSGATGYGGANEARANLYLKLIVNLRKTTGRESIEIDDYNENTADEWAVEITEDGWYEIYLFACKVWSAVITYDLGNIVYHVATDTFYKSLSNGNLNNAVTDTDYWEETDDIEDFLAAVDDEQDDVYEATEDSVETYFLEQCEAKALVQAGCGCDSKNDGMQTYEKLRMKVEAIAIHEALGNYSDAQEIVENATSICETCINNE